MTTTLTKHWEEAMKDISFRNWSSMKKDGIFQLIITHYSETHRLYHSISHLEDMFCILERTKSPIKSTAIVNLAVFFHDIIYDPTSTTNEEDSAELFKTLFIDDGDIKEVEPLLERRRSQDREDIINQVYHYIIMTKQHNVSNSEEDSDLQYFIDADMSILGQDRAIYSNYASAIRQEYCHVPHELYCEKRAGFLRSTLSCTNRYIYASTLFRDSFEDKARDNLEWECSLLEQGIIPISG